MTEIFRRPYTKHRTALMTLLLILCASSTGSAQSDAVGRLERAASLVRDKRIAEAEREIASVLDQEFFSLYHNQKDLTFIDEPGEVAASTQLLSGWGLKFLDYDNDDDLDALVVNNGEPPLLLRNEGGNRNNWIGLHLVATKSNAAATGATITWHAGGVKRSRLKTSGGSYLASHDPRELLGLGAATKIDSLEIRWASGKTDKLTNLPINTYIKVVEGEGVVKGSAAAQTGSTRRP